CPSQRAQHRLTRSPTRRTHGRRRPAAETIGPSRIARPGPVYIGSMGSDDGMRVVGTIRSIELYTLAAKFQNVTSRQVAKIQLDIERATDEEGEELDVVNLADLHFQGPAELVPRFSAGDPVQIVTSAE